MPTVTWVSTGTGLANQAGWLGNGQVNPYGSGYYIDSGAGNDGIAAGVRLTGAGFSGTITSAILTVTRFSDDGGASGTARLRFVAENNPGPLDTATLATRTYRDAYIEFTIPTDGSALILDVTAQIQDLLTAGFVYTGSQVIVPVIADSNAGSGWGSSPGISWRALWYQATPPTLSITYTEGAANVYTLTATPATVAAVAQSQAVRASRRISATTSSVSIPAQTANLNYTAPVVRQLICTPGTVAVSAQSQTIRKSRRLSATPASVATPAAIQSLTFSGAVSRTIVSYSSFPYIPDGWPHGSSGIVRDNIGSSHDLIFLAWDGSEMMLYRSTNYMASATPVTRTGGTSITNNGQGAIAQDSEGNIHLLHRNGSGARWCKITITRTGGSVTSFSVGADVQIPGDWDSSDWRFDAVQCFTATGVEQMVFMGVYGIGGAHRHIMFRSDLSPASISDFKKLTDGTAGFDVVYTYTNASDSSHSYHGHFAQVGSTRDILCAAGPLNVGHGGIEDHVCYTRVLTASGTNWTIGGLTARGSNNGVSRQYLYQCYGTQTDAWIMWHDPDHGVRFDRLTSGGTYTARAVPEPETRANYNGVGAFTVSSVGRIHATYVICDNSMNYIGAYWAFWNGAQWNVTFDFLEGDVWGFFHSIGWDNGVAAMFTPDSGTNSYMGSLRSTVAYSVQATSANVSVNTQSQTLRRSRLWGATPATITTTGQTVGMRKNKRIAAQSQTVTTVAQSVSLRSNRVLGATSYALGLTAQTQTLRKSRLLTVSSASVTSAAQSANLTHSTVNHYTLTGTPLAFGVTAQGATLLAHRRIGANAASVVTTGQQVTLTHTTVGHYEIIATPGTLSLSVQSVGLRATRRIAASNASLAVATQPVGLRANRRLGATSSALNATAQVVGLTWSPSGSHVLTASPGSIGVAAQSVALRKSNRLYATDASVSTSSATAGLYLGHTLTALPATVATVAQDQSILRNARIIATSRAINTTWSTVQINYSGTVQAEPWLITGTGGEGLSITVVFSGQGGPF